MTEKKRTKSNHKKKDKSKAKLPPTDEEDLSKPGNRRYLSYYVYQGEWRPTKPLKSVAAAIAGPGPAGVNLPMTIGDQGTDLRKIKSPAYKMGMRDLTQYTSVTPGPAVYNTRALTNKGRDECHGPVIGNKLEGLTISPSPGPATYNRADGDAMVYTKSPAFTMRSKVQRDKYIAAPAPSSYTLPETFGLRKTLYGGGPAYTIGEKFDDNGIIVNPGPAAYKLPPTDIHKTRPPAYTIGCKTHCRITYSESPGPASNELHLVKFHKPAPPRCTFGIKHSPYKAFQRFSTGD